MTRNHQKIISTAGLVLLLFIFFGSIPSNLFVRVPWLDIPMHFLGGFFAALFVVAFFGAGIEKMTFIQKMVFITGAAMIVGVGWEWFEWVIDTFIKTNFMGNRNDTLFDLVMDLAGGLVVAAAAIIKPKTVADNPRS
jgi:hypothetical protein